MRLFGEALKNGDEVQIVLNNDYHGYAGNVIIENDVIIEVTSYNGKQTYIIESPGKPELSEIAALNYL